MKPNPNVFTFLDLELNNPKTTQDIIQIGTVVGNVETGEVLEKLLINVNSQTILSEYISNLTGITQEDHDAGLCLIAATVKLCDLHKKYNSHPSVVQWGHGDLDLLKNQVNGGIELGCFGWRYIDVKTIFQFICLAEDKKLQSGLSKSMNRLGLTFKGTKHTAADDAENTFFTFKYLLDMTRCNNLDNDIIVDQRRISD